MAEWSNAHAWRA